MWVVSIFSSNSHEQSMFDCLKKDEFIRNQMMSNLSLIYSTACERMYKQTVENKLPFYVCFSVSFPPQFLPAVSVFYPRFEKKKASALGLKLYQSI